MVMGLYAAAAENSPPPKTPMETITPYEEMASSPPRANDDVDRKDGRPPAETTVRKEAGGAPSERVRDEREGGEEECDDYNRHHYHRTKMLWIGRWIVLCSIIVLTVYFSSVAYVCGAQYFWREDGSWIVSLCRPLTRAGWTWKIQGDRSGFPMWPPTAPLVALLCVLPALLLAFPSLQPTRRHLLRKRRGDPSAAVWAIALLVAPTVAILVLMSGRPLSDKYLEQLERYGYDGDPLKVWFKAVVVKYANVTGYCATVCLSLFLVPVSKQSPIMEALGLSPALAVGFHVWAGRLCWMLVTVHGGLYAIDRPMFSEYEGDDDEWFASFWEKALYELVPSNSYGNCFRWRWPWDFATDDDGDHCYKPWRNFTGILSGFFLLLVVMTSWNRIRRRYYRTFIVSHLVFGSLMLWFAVLHFYWIGLYLLPGMLYYLCCSLPIVSKQLFMGGSGDDGGGIKVASATSIHDSNGCFELRLSASMLSSSSPCSPIRYPAYVRVGIPDINGRGIAGRVLWHPFTIASPICGERDDKRRPPELRLLIRSYGWFTSELHRMIQSDEEVNSNNDNNNNNNNNNKLSYTIHVDTLYWGADWISEIRRHDVSLLIAGGIGITPILSVLLELLQRRTKMAGTGPADGDDDYSGVGGASMSSSGRDIRVHWYCRERALVEYVVANYLEPALLEDGELQREEGGRALVDDALVDASLGKNRCNETIRLSIYVTGSSHPQDGFEDEEAPSSLRERNVGNSQRTRVGGSQPFLGTTRGMRRLMAGTLVGTTMVHLVYYNVAVWEFRDRIFFRGYILYVAIFVVTAGTFLREACRKRSCPHHQLVPTVDDGCRDDIGDGENDGGTAAVPPSSRAFNIERPDASGKTPKVISEHWRAAARTGRPEFSMEVFDGRPILGDVVRPAVEAARPAVFYCGPGPLREDVSRSITLGRGARRRAGALADARCAFFKEHFEL